MEMKTVVNYETPEVEVIEVEVEKGFATSGGDGTSNLVPGEEE